MLCSCTLTTKHRASARCSVLLALLRIFTGHGGSPNPLSCGNVHYAIDHYSNPQCSAHCAVLAVAPLTDTLRCLQVPRSRHTWKDMPGTLAYCRTLDLTRSCRQSPPWVMGVTKAGLSATHSGQQMAPS